MSAARKYEEPKAQDWARFAVLDLQDAIVYIDVLQDYSSALFACENAITKIKKAIEMRKVDKRKKEGAEGTP